MIHVVGLYKCGTSWLLHMLAAHPEVVGWREFDVLRATYALSRSLTTLPYTALDYLNPRPDDDSWMKRREAATPRSSQMIFREIFMGRGWIPIMGVERQHKAERLSTTDLEKFLDQLLELSGYRVRPTDSGLIDPRRITDRLGVQSFRRGDLLALMEAVRDTSEPQQLPRQFFECLRAQTLPGTKIATKAADQLLQIQALKDASPGSRIVAIVRDGRDAAISAKHFETLMRKREAPWKTNQASYLRRIVGWSMRAAKLAEHARRGDITVLRYEDLQQNFTTVCQALFLDLGLDASADVIDSVQTATDFATVTKGRNPGQEAEHQIRKGSSGEWREALSNSQARVAWRIAGKSLEAFGYRQDGSLEPSSLVLCGDSAGA
ncbi:sulfotransferase domain-containing protein [Congregibacter brevis]|uniref:Sulfotransferase domain-containing protein n=1 Tax=Congregibacter brevis TaxID=3081201 RepID=A0ABZ0IJA5_9GAMM|nr:sulfotransferase domain-containing protein [Congregibacter sp. IMCC45268]